MPGHSSKPPLNRAPTHLWKTLLLPAKLRKYKWSPHPHSQYRHTIQKLNRNIHRHPFTRIPRDIRQRIYASQVSKLNQTVAALTQKLAHTIRTRLQHIHRQAGGPATDPSANPPATGTIPITSYFERQHLQMCQVHALNMLRQPSGANLITGTDILDWCAKHRNIALPMGIRWSDQYNPSTGNFSDLVMALWMYDTQNLTLQVALNKDDNPEVGMEAPATLPRINSITIQGMDSALRHMQENNAYQLQGFILKTVEQEGYLHATALVKHRNVWSWLDSERPERSNITVGLQGRDNLLELQRVAHIAYVPLQSALHLPTTTHTHAHWS